MLKGYQGYSSWNAWNVALHLGNHENLYQAMIAADKSSQSLTKKIEAFRKISGVKKNSKTLDGAIYTDNAIGEAFSAFGFDR